MTSPGRWGIFKVPPSFICTTVCCGDSTVADPGAGSRTAVPGSACAGRPPRPVRSIASIKACVVCSLFSPEGTPVVAAVLPEAVLGVLAPVAGAAGALAPVAGAAGAAAGAALPAAAGVAAGAAGAVPAGAVVPVAGALPEPAECIISFTFLVPGIVDNARASLALL
jgi:hypothetical protein